MSKLVAALSSGRTLLMDGAMASELRRYVAVDCCERLNLEKPALVRSIHQAHARAGSRVFLTNTFQANPASLLRFKLARLKKQIWQAALRLARAEAGDGLVLADIGPIADVSAATASNLWTQCDGADGILLETWSSILALDTFANARKRSKLPLLVSFTYRRNRRRKMFTFADAAPEACARAAKRCGALALGANCGLEIGMADMLEIVKRYHDAVDLPVFVRPNAGTPTPTPGGWQYPRTPDEMAAGLAPLLEEGLAMVGGCCGVGPTHIQCFHTVLNAFSRDAERRAAGRHPAALRFASRLNKKNTDR